MGIAIHEREYRELRSAARDLFPTRDDFNRIVGEEDMGAVTKQSIREALVSTGENPDQWRSVHVTVRWDDNTQDTFSIFKKVVDVPGFVPRYRGPHP